MTALRKETAVQAVGHAQGQEADLVRTLVNTRSSTEAGLALVVLKDLIPEDSLVFFVNLRELLSELPATPFSAGCELDILERVLGYEKGETSYRRAFYNKGGLFGLEIFGEANRVDHIEIVKLGAHISLRQGVDGLVEPDALELFLEFEDLGDTIVEALRNLGMSLSPRFYYSVADYVLENGAAGVTDVFGELF
jgi:hypothetical protein